MHQPLPVQLLIVLLVGLPLVMIAHRFGISTIIAYSWWSIAQVTGLVRFEEVLQPAEIGAALLLFALGLELDLIAIKQRWQQLLTGVVGQIGSTISLERSP